MTMSDIKLPRLPERVPAKLNVTLSPELKCALDEYAALYASTYGQEEPVAELVPAMLTAFLDSDRTFQRVRNARAKA